MSGRLVRQPAAILCPLAGVLLTALAAGCAPAEPGAGGERLERLQHPTAEMLAERAPDTVRVRFETSRGVFVVEAYRAWAPHGVDRFYQLVKAGFYDGTSFYRVIGGMIAQWGLSGNPDVSAAWRDRSIPDDPVAQTNARGTLAFATRGPDTRSTQLFINQKDNASFDGMGFAPIGRVVEGMGVADSLYSGYGEVMPMGDGPNPTRIGGQGNEYLARTFPKLDSIVSAAVVVGGRR